MALLLASSLPAWAEPPANTLRDLFDHLDRCLVTASATAGSEITIVFSLRRDGSLLGKPKITHSHLVGDARAQRAFVLGSVGALARCLPLPITDGLGGAIAGRPLSIRIVGHAREIGT